MNSNAYHAVRKDPSGAGVGIRRRAWLALTGRDRQSFLNGQVSNDVLYLQPGHGVHACLLKNTGQMLANLYIHAGEEDLWIEVTRSRAALVKETLERFIVRERVEIEDRSDRFDTLTVQGQGAREIVATILEGAWPDQALMPLSNSRVATSLGLTAGLIQHTHTTASNGFDLIVPAEAAERMLEALLQAQGAHPLDWETLQVLRIEAGIPKWGAELDENVIPLEANLYSAISQSKGCYMGQEVIARIIARGHTNRSLVGLRLNRLAEPNTDLVAEEGPRRNQDPGRITSVADSPEAGPIALGYVRNEFLQLGAKLHAVDSDLEATIATLPFVA